MTWFQRNWPYAALAVFVLSLAWSQKQNSDQSNQIADQNDAIVTQQAQIQESVGANRVALCGFAQVVASNPTFRFPHETPGQHRRRVRAYRTVIRLSSDIDCQAVLLEAIRRQRAEGGGHQNRVPQGHQLPGRLRAVGGRVRIVGPRPPRRLLQHPLRRRPRTCSSASRIHSSPSA